ncbi:response regulator [Chitinimonas koreensis]|uniref:response regulator n=1 Tax=Chitinimonas koreensis TaxID=356302 RepID=UPI0003FA979C|nr:response regulator [Chitinimonas koreensis]QNM94861.1 response regulator [Chitinimonas koreensis]
MAQPVPERVLILVDDEPSMLSSLARLFRYDGYRIRTAPSGEAGLALLQADPVAVVLSDQRMPQMDGTTFLAEVERRFPDTVRLILTGYGGIDQLIEAADRGTVWKFLSKPWNNDQLRMQIAAAFERLELLLRQDGFRPGPPRGGGAEPAILPAAILQLSSDCRVLTLNDQACRLLPGGETLAGRLLDAPWAAPLRQLAGTVARQRLPLCTPCWLAGRDFQAVCLPEPEACLRLCLYPVGTDMQRAAA